MKHAGLPVGAGLKRVRKSHFITAESGKALKIL